MEDNIIKAMLLLNERVADLDKNVSEIKQQIGNLKKRPDALFKEEWMDGQDVKLALNISERTLQTLRDSGILTPTRLLGKYYYKVSDIKGLLAENYVRNHLPKKNKRHD